MFYCNFLFFTVIFLLLFFLLIINKSQDFLARYRFSYTSMHFCTDPTEELYDKFEIFFPPENNRLQKITNIPTWSYFRHQQVKSVLFWDFYYCLTRCFSCSHDHMPIPFLKEVLTLLDYKLITNSSFETGVFPFAFNTLWCNHLSKPDNDLSDFNYCSFLVLSKF